MTLDDIYSKIGEANTFVILAHENPDGDALGSCTAFATLLKNMGKEKIDILFQEYPAIFDFLPNSKLIKKDASLESYDMAIVLDCPEIKRISKEYHELFDSAKVTVQFDHHLRNGMFADYNIVNQSAPACAEILASSFRYLEVEMTVELATCLMTGIITDTGGFRFESITPETFEFASWSLSHGVNVSKIYKDALTTKTKSQFDAEKLATDRLEFFEDNKITFTYVTKEDEAKLGVLPGELEGIANIGTAIEGVEVAIFAKQKDNGFKLSLRSNRIDVSEICMIFGGGGHKFASGVRLKDFSVVDDIVEALDKACLDYKSK